jgi:hypothetical protein
MNERLNVLYRHALATRAADLPQQDSAYRGPATANGENGAEEQQGRLIGAFVGQGRRERGSWGVRMWRDGKRAPE